MELSGPGMELMSLALAGGFFTTKPPGKPCILKKFSQIEIFFKTLNVQVSKGKILTPIVLRDHSFHSLFPSELVNNSRNLYWKVP